MFIDYSTWDSCEYVLNSLNLDLNNPRLGYRNERLNQSEILKFLIENEEVYELAKKISEEGYFVGQEPIICIENNKKIEIDDFDFTNDIPLVTFSLYNPDDIDHIDFRTIQNHYGRLNLLERMREKSNEIITEIIN